MRLLVALPCLDEEATIVPVLARIPRDIIGVDRIEVLVVDDGSTDRSAELARTAGVRVISHAGHRGLGAAFQTALDVAVRERFDLLVSVDADGQFDPQDIAQLVRPILDGRADFVTGSRFADSTLTPEMPALRRWGNARMSALVSRLTGRRFHDVSCGFRAYGREALLQLNLHARFTYTQEVFLDLAHKGLRIEEVPVRVRYFAGRTSRVAPNLFVYGWRTASIIARMYRDHHPWRFFSRIALLLITSGAAFASVLVAHYVSTGRFSGQIWAGFVGGALAFAGLVFLVLGVVADMLERVRANQERILRLLKERPTDDQSSAISSSAARASDRTRPSV